MAMAIVHGGAAVHVLCSSVFNFLSGMKPRDIVVRIDEVPDESVRDMLWKVINNQQLLRLKYNYTNVT